MNPVSQKTLVIAKVVSSSYHNIYKY
ncbi:hypothetical protein CKAH01_18916 [Colletotrichum kahawae]|uniref:Uncharacterized protein n=1 Tax=Colletotrichum kahawae TaxID=34407 RepID=A0AAD9Y3H2_COLKA|nr:hypothetical protein CKAH01_18916 [Colletotrichum kahawae]